MKTKKSEMISNNDFENCRIFLLKELNIKNTGVELLPGNYVKATIKFASQQSSELTAENERLKEENADLKQRLELLIGGV